MGAPSKPWMADEAGGGGAANEWRDRAEAEGSLLDESSITI
jgi:hypothetical protein